MICSACGGACSRKWKQGGQMEGSRLRLLQVAMEGVGEAGVKMSNKDTGREVGEEDCGGGAESSEMLG